MVLGTEDADSISTPTKAAAHANTNMDHVSTNEPVLWVGVAPSEKADAGASPANMAKFNLALNEEAHSCSTLNIAPWGYETTPPCSATPSNTRRPSTPLAPRSSPTGSKPPQAETSPPRKPRILRTAENKQALSGRTIRLAAA